MKFQESEPNGREHQYFYDWQKDLIKILPKDKKILEIGLENIKIILDRFFSI